MSTHSPWQKEYRDATAAPHPAVKERVWRTLQDGPRPRRSGVRLVVALATVAVVSAGIVAAWPRARTEHQAANGFAYSTTNARYELEGRRLELSSGRVAISAWAAPVTVVARSTQVVVESAVAVIDVAGDRVVVRAVDGAVSIDGVRQLSSAASRAEAGALPELEALEPRDARLLRAEAAAAVASQEHRWTDARAALDVVAGSSSLRAEAALLARGELELRQLKDPSTALASFDEGDARFPSGALAMERALSALEASVATNQWSDAQARAERFLARFPDSNRGAEVRAVRASALDAQGKLTEACAAAAELSAPLPFATKCNRR